MKVILTCLALSAVLSGCAPTSEAGPFVTNLSFDGDRTLHIEKCSVGLNSDTDNVSNDHCYTTDIKLRPTKAC